MKTRQFNQGTYHRRRMFLTFAELDQYWVGPPEGNVWVRTRLPIAFAFDKLPWGNKNGIEVSDRPCDAGSRSGVFYLGWRTFVSIPSTTLLDTTFLQSVSSFGNDDTRFPKASERFSRRMEPTSIGPIRAHSAQGGHDNAESSRSSHSLKKD